jgi:hypothetical protein
MRNIIVTFILILMSSQAHAFVDAAINGTINSAKAVADAAHQKFVEIKWVENLRMLNQNYNDSKRFHDQMVAIAQHRGGVGGYVQEKMERNLSNIGDEAIWKLDRHMKSEPDDTAYVKKWIVSTDKKVEATFDYSEQIREIGNKKAKETADLKEKAGKGTLSNQEYDSAMLHAALLQIETLTIMNKNLELLLKQQRDKDEAEWAAERKQRSDAAKTAKTHADAYKDLKKLKAGPKKDPMKVLMEVPQK